MAAAVGLARWLVRPSLARTASAAEASRDFDRNARLFLRRPPFLCHLVVPGAGPGRPAMHRITAGRVMPGRAVLYLHGGAFIAGSPTAYAALCGRIARLSATEVMVPDYPLLPDAVFPAAPDAALAAWEIVLALGHDPGDIVIGGDSAGGNLAFGLLARVLARGQRPAGLFAFSPWTDMTLSGESLRTLGPRDPILPVSRMAEVAATYLAGAEAGDPLASPLFASYPDPPPVLIQVGAEEALLDDSRRMADRLRAAGGTVTLEEWPGAPHVWQMLDGWLPESRAALKRVGQFVQTSFASASL